MNADDPRGARAVIGELVRDLGRNHDDIARRGAVELLAELEGQIPRLDNERLVVGMAMEPGPFPRLARVEDERDARVVGSASESLDAQLLRVYDRDAS